MKIDTLLKEIFRDILKVKSGDLDLIDQNKSKNWDSVNHMNLIFFYFKPGYDGKEIPIL